MKTWQYSQNPFLNATEGSFRAAMEISTFHDSALYAARADPFFLALYTAYHVIHLAFKAAYEAWLAQGGMQQGDTQSIQDLIDLLSNTKIQDWDIAIQAIYKQSTAQYKKLLPGRRQPFQTGSKADRIHNVQALSNAMGTDAALATVKADVESFYAELIAGQLNQKSSVTTTRSTSSVLEAARVAMCNAQFSNYGGLIQKFAATPTVIEKYFDLATIRRAQQYLFTGHVAAGQVYNIAKRTFAEGDEVLLINSGHTTLKFYLASAKDELPGTVFLSLASGQQTVVASTLGKLTDPYIMVQNLDALMEGSFVVQLL